MIRIEEGCWSLLVSAYYGTAVRVGSETCWLGLHHRWLLYPCLQTWWRNILSKRWRWALLFLGSQQQCLSRTWLTEGAPLQKSGVWNSSAGNKWSEVPKADLRWRSSWAFAQDNIHAWGRDPQGSQQPEGAGTVAGPLPRQQDTKTKEAPLDLSGCLSCSACLCNSAR